MWFYILILIILAIIGIVVLVIIILVYIERTELTRPITEPIKEVEITLDQKEYKADSDLKLKIKNNLDKKICFSSCYPYYLERDVGGMFAAYQYGICLMADVAEVCVESEKVKSFEIILNKIKTDNSSHRFAVPVCVGCTFQESFREDSWFYSNEFIIK